MTVASQTCSLKTHDRLIDQALTFIRSGQSILITGIVGSGKSTIARSLQKSLEETGTLDYSGSLKVAIANLAESLGVATENEDGKPLNIEAVKAEIKERSDGLVIVGDNSTRYPAGLRYWLQSLIEEGAVVCLFAIERKNLDIFLQLTHLEMPLPSDLDIREIMHREAIALGLQIPPGTFSQLQKAAGTNLMLAKKVVREYSLGNFKDTGEHAEYIDILPLFMAAISGLTILRFIGMGTGDKALYLIGGVSLAIFMSLRLTFQFLNQKQRRLGK